MPGRPLVVELHGRPAAFVMLRDDRVVVRVDAALRSLAVVQWRSLPLWHEGMVAGE